MDDRFEQLTQTLDAAAHPAIATILTAFGIAVAAALFGQLLYFIGRRVLRETSLTHAMMMRAAKPMSLVWPLVALLVFWDAAPGEFAWLGLIKHITTLLLILFVTLSGAGFARGIGDRVLQATEPDIKRGELSARRIYTQAQLLTRMVIFGVCVIGVATALMTFPGVRQLGASLLASAGVAGIVIGFAARPVLSNLLAGIQIALTQPIRLEDVVIVEGEWGWIEEIKATYVVVRIWDERRLVLPLQWFIDHPFQNWTRYSSRLIGSVYWWVDYRKPLQPIRDEIKRACEGAPEWDGRLAMLQVTDSTERGIQLRALVTAPDAPRAWDLRCRVREAVIDMIQRDYPDYLPRLRTELHSSSSATEPPYPEGDGPQRLSPELHTPPPPDRPPPEA